MPQYPVLKLTNIQALACGSELGFTCDKRICVCTPDQNNTSKIPACEVVGDKMPDCYLVEILGTKRIAMVIECRCNVQPGSRTLKEPAKLEKDVDAKFQNFSGQG